MNQNKSIPSLLRVLLPIMVLFAVGVCVLLFGSYFRRADEAFTLLFPYGYLLAWGALKIVPSAVIFIFVLLIVDIMQLIFYITSMAAWAKEGQPRRRMLILLTIHFLIAVIALFALKASKGRWWQ